MAIKSVFGAQKKETVWLWWREVSHAGGLILSMAWTVREEKKRNKWCLINEIYDKIIQLQFPFSSLGGSGQ